MANFSLGYNISLGGKYEIAREESLANQNGAENKNHENRRIASLAVSVNKWFMIRPLPRGKRSIRA